MVGVVVILLVLFVVGPVVVFAGGALWSALLGLMLSKDADT